jgi:hypothetical protein
MSTDLLCRIGDIYRFTVPDWGSQQIYCDVLEMSTYILCKIGDVSRFTVPDWRYHWYRDEHPSVIEAI